MKQKERFIHRQAAVYCIAKPAPYMAIFAAPPTTKNDEYYTPYPVVQNKTAAECKVGQWYEIAYHSTPSYGQNEVMGKTPIIPWPPESKTNKGGKG